MSVGRVVRTIRIAFLAFRADETQLASGLQHLDQPTEFLDRPGCRNMDDMALEGTLVVEDQFYAWKLLFVGHGSSSPE